MSNRLDPEMLEEAVEAFDTFVDAVRASGLAEDPHFRAYHLASLEGESGGWIGGRYLVDALRDALDEAQADDDDLDSDDLDAARAAVLEAHGLRGDVALDEACRHGHFGCSWSDGGPCIAELEAAAASREAPMSS